MMAKDEKKLALRWFKREILDLHKMVTKELSVTNGTVSSDLLDELEHFLSFGQSQIKILKDLL